MLFFVCFFLIGIHSMQCLKATTSQLKINGYQFPFLWRDRDNRGGGKIVFIKQGLIVNRLKQLETKISVTIFLELTISNKKWLLVFAYWPPNNANKQLFFYELTESLSKAVNNYENILLTGDLNINTLTQTNSNNTTNHLTDFCDPFALSNLVNVKTCTKSMFGTSLDIMLTNRPRSFYNASAVTTGLSDCHKLILSCLRAHFKRLPPKKIIYRDYKMFDEAKFLHDLDQEMIKVSFYQHEEAFAVFSSVFRDVVDRHAPLKQKMVRGNNAPFMTKQLNKAIMDRSRIKNRYLKWPTENFLELKKAKRLSKNLTKKGKKQYFKSVSSMDLTTNKKLWDVVKTSSLTKTLIVMIIFRLMIKIKLLIMK